MLVHVILEDLSALNDTPSYVHTAAFVDLVDASHYVSEAAKRTIKETENRDLTLEYLAYKVNVLHKGAWVGAFEIQVVDIQ